jgi:hypothetical protein
MLSKLLAHPIVPFKGNFPNWKLYQTPLALLCLIASPVIFWQFVICKKPLRH